MKLFHGAAAATISLLVLAASACAQGLPALGHLLPYAPPSHTQWVAGSLKEMQTIKVGMTRAQLLRVFHPDAGGVFSRTSQQYVYHECPYFKVNVSFRPVGKAKGYEGGKIDKIVTISAPYLQWPVYN